MSKCKFCGIEFQPKNKGRYNCDLHFRMKRPEVEAARALKISKTKTGVKRAPFSEEWKAKLRVVLKNAVNTAVRGIPKSSATKEKLREARLIQADHIKPFAFFPELRFELSNGRTLCIDCHKKTPTFGNRKHHEVK